MGSLTFPTITRHGMLEVVAALTPEDVTRALAGDRAAMKALVDRLQPLIHAEVGAALAQVARRRAMDPRQDIRDFVQDILLHLLAHDARTLRRWAPERGRSLDSFVRLVARRQIISMLRSPRRNPSAELPTDRETIERLDTRHEHEPELDAHLVDSQTIARLLEFLHARLNDKGVLLFHLLYVEERAIAEVCELTGMTRESIYAWRMRLKQLALESTESLCVT